MKKTSPPNALWWVAIVLAILGILMFEDVLGIKGVSSFWVEVIAFGLMAIAAFVK
jgi:hypothetical protein